MGRYALRPRKNRPAPVDESVDTSPPPSPPPKSRKRAKRRTTKTVTKPKKSTVVERDDSELVEMEVEVDLNNTEINSTEKKPEDSIPVEERNDSVPMDSVKETTVEKDTGSSSEEEVDEEEEAAADAEFEAAALNEAELAKDADFVPNFNADDDEEEEDDVIMENESPTASPPGEWDESPPPSPQLERRRKSTTTTTKKRSKKTGGKKTKKPKTAFFNDATVEHLFRALDSDNNGRIVASDIQRVADDHGHFFTADELRDMVRFWDSSGTSSVDVQSFRVLARDVVL